MRPTYRNTNVRHLSLSSVDASLVHLSLVYRSCYVVKHIYLYFNNLPNLSIYLSNLTASQRLHHQRNEKISNKSSFGIIDIAESSTSDRIIVIVETACFIHDGAYR